MKAEKKKKVKQHKVRPFGHLVKGTMVRSPTNKKRKKSRGVPENQTKDGAVLKNCMSDASLRSMLEIVMTI